MSGVLNSIGIRQYGDTGPRLSLIEIAMSKMRTKVFEIQKMDTYWTPKFSVDS
jgi:hypothetical protein